MDGVQQEIWKETITQTWTQGIAQTMRELGFEDEAWDTRDEWRVVINCSNGAGRCTIHRET